MTYAETAITEGLRRSGCDVFRDGWPDLLVQARGVTLAVELKGPDDNVRPNQAAIHEALRRVMPVYVVRHSPPDGLGGVWLGDGWREVADRLDLSANRVAASIARAGA